MIDDSDYGVDKKKAYWQPKKKISYGPVFKWPPNLSEWRDFFFKIPGYFFPTNFLYAVGAVLIWYFLTPPLETMKNISLEWISLILVRNLVLAVLIIGAWHVWFYVWKKQDVAYKYNRRWPEGKSSNFTFKNQTADNMFWSLASGVPIWTAYECLLLWAYANGTISTLNFQEHPVGFLLLFMLVTFIHEAGFYVVHRILHWPPLYKTVHALHHRNINPGPWSGLSMHPVEHIMYFSTSLLFFLIPSHPVHMINLLSRLGLAASQGHTGFDRVVVGENKSIDNGFYAHYLHHRYFEVNYSDGMIPLDKWFGTFHDGSPESHAEMLARFKERNARSN